MKWWVLTCPGTESVLRGGECRAEDGSETLGTGLVHVCMPGRVMDDFSKSGHIVGEMLQYPSDALSVGFACAVGV